MTSIDIRYFNPKQMKDGAVILVIGRRGTGKSTLIADLMSYKRDIKRGVCVSATEKQNGFYKQHVPPCFVFDEYEDGILESLFEMQSKVKGITGNVEPAFCILDDVLYDRAFVKSKQARKLFMNGRHDKIFCIVACQYITDLPPSLRSQIDYVIALRDPIRANRERLYNLFAGQFPTFEAFDHVFQACTSGHEALVLDQNSLSYDLGDSVFFYLSTPGLQYRIGAEEYWRFSGREAERQRSGSKKKDEEASRGVASITIRKRYPKKSQQ